jgi:large subunit ribosomal protein L14
MIQLKTKLLVTDKTAIVNTFCIKILKGSKCRIAILGEVILICVNTINIKKHIMLKPRLQKKFKVGSIHRGLIVRTMKNFWRIKDLWIKFNENSIVIISKQIVPLSNRVYGPVLREFCMRWPSLGCVAVCII